MESEPSDIFLDRTGHQKWIPGDPFYVYEG